MYHIIIAVAMFIIISKFDLEKKLPEIRKEIELRKTDK